MGFHCRLDGIRRYQRHVGHRLLRSSRDRCLGALDVALSLAIADEVEARDTLDTANVALSAIVGMDLSQTAALPILGEKPLKLPLASGDYRYWEQKAAAHNPDILSAGHSVEEKRGDAANLLI